MAADRPISIALLLLMENLPYCLIKAVEVVVPEILVSVALWVLMEKLLRRNITAMQVVVPELQMPAFL
jgi:hypothetical protein